MIFGWLKNSREWLDRFFDNTPKEPQVKYLSGKVPSKKSLDKMTKAQLESMGRDEGIELDRRLTKDKLINQLHTHLKQS